MSLWEANSSHRFSSGDTMKYFALRLGGTFISERMFLMPLTSTFMVSTSASSFAKFHSSVYSGHGASMMVSSSGQRVQKISSVINGIYGCNIFNALVSTVFRTQSAVFAAFGSSSFLYRRTFAISIYQSQNSSQMKSYTF